MNINIGLGSKRKTLLLIDDDPYSRSSLRKALEAASFSVGEAASLREGERTCLRVRPDAVIVDLMAQTLSASIEMANILKRVGRLIPIYIFSTAAEALMSSVELGSLGIAGIFLRPADNEVVIQILKTRLGTV